MVYAFTNGKVKFDGFIVGSVAKLFVPIAYKLMMYGFSSLSLFAMESVAVRVPVPVGVNVKE